MLADGVERLHTAPVKLHGRADAVRTGTEDYDALLLVVEVDIALHTAVSDIEVIGLCGILGGKRVNLLDHRQDAQRLTQISDDQHGLVHVVQFALQSHGTRNLEISEAVDLRRTQEFTVKDIHTGAFLQCLVDVDDVLQLIEEPLVNLRQVMNLIYRIAAVHGLGDDEHTLVSRLAQ